MQKKFVAKEEFNCTVMEVKMIEVKKYNPKKKKILYLIIEFFLKI
jgi:hypothetical protein